MLTSEQISQADKYVQLFYQELAKTPEFASDINVSKKMGMLRGHHGKREFSKLDKSLSYLERRAQLEGFYLEQLKESEQQFREIYRTDKIGLPIPIKRVPVINYVCLGDQRENFNFFHQYIFYNEPENQAVLRDFDFQLGINPEILKATYWLHSNAMNCVVVNPSGAFRETKINKPIDIGCHVQQNLEEDIQGIFSSMLYYGLDKDYQEKLCLIVDSSESTSLVSQDQKILDNLFAATDRYGIDVVIALSATKHLTEKGWDVTPRTRLRFGDEDYIDLKVTDLKKFAQTELKRQEQDTFWRLFVQSPEVQEALKNPDIQQGWRDVLRLRNHYTMERRLQDYIDEKLNLSS